MATITTSSFPDTPFGAPPRPLAEGVLQSAGEAVLTNPASVEILQEEEPGPDQSLVSPERHSDRLARIVGEKPLQSALVAMVAGGLLAALLKRALRRRPR